MMLNKMSFFTAFIRREQWLLAGLLMVLAVRLLYIGVIFHHESSDVLDRAYRSLAPKSMRNAATPEALIQDDAFLYDYLGWEFSQGRPMDCPARIAGNQDVASPGFPFFLGIIYKVFGRSLAAVLVCYSVLDTLTAVLLVLFIRRFSKSFSRISELYFLMLFAVYLPYVTVVIMPLTEGLFIFLIVSFFILYAAADRGGRIRTLVGAGAVLGLATLTRPITLLFPLWLMFWQLLFPGGAERGRVIKNNVIAGVAMLMTILPWSIRNYIRYDSFILINSNASLVATGTDLNSSAGEKVRNAKLVDEVQQASEKGMFVMYSEVIIRILMHPIEYLRLWVLKIARLWFNLGFKARPSPGSLLTAFAQLCVMVAGGYVLFRYPRVRIEMFVPLHLIAYVTFFHVLFFTAKIRFIMPLMPILLMLSALALVNAGTGTGKWLRRSGG